MYVLKEKFERIKQSLEEWHTNYSKNMEGRIKEAKEDFIRLETKGEIEGISEEEISIKREKVVHIYKLSKLNGNIQ